MALSVSGGSAASNISGTFAARPAAGVPGRTYYPTDGGLLAIDDGVKWRPQINGVLGKSPPIAAGWTAVNAPTSLADANGALLFVGVNDAAATNFRGYDMPATAYAVAAISSIPDTLVAGVANVGPYLRESATNKIYNFCYTLHQTNSVSYVFLEIWNGLGTRVSETTFRVANDQNMPVFLRTRISGANVLAEVSRNLITWSVMDSRLATSVFTAAPDRAGIGSLGFNCLPSALVTHFDFA